jgi:hypothetical protein
VLPADARRFRVVDEEVAAALAACGAELVEHDADVEIAPIAQLRGAAPVAVVRFGPTVADGETHIRRLAERLRAYTVARLGALSARSALRRRGLRHTTVLAWDIEQRLRVTSPRRRRRRAEPKLGLAEKLPGGTVVVGSRSTPTPTLLEAAFEAAASIAGESNLGLDWPMVRASGVLVVPSKQFVLKVAVGRGASDVERHRMGVELASSATDGALRRYLPRLDGHGEAGLARWSLEGRIDGDVPAALSPSLLGDCLELLVGLHAARPVPPRWSLTRSAAAIGMTCDRDRGQALTALARRLDHDLDDLPRGIGHGDFWTGNLLAAGDRLRGVIDWAAARPDQLPLLDLINLLVGERESKYFGRALYDYLLPWARAGGDAVSRAYCDRLGLDIGPSQLEALSVAWWLERVARELEEYGDRVRRPEWLERNVALVLDALLAGERL